MAKQNFKVTGPVYWAKIVGDPVPNYNEDGNEWTFDLSLDEVNANEIKKLGLGSKIKNKGGDRGDYITFKRPEMNRRSGEKNKPIPIINEDGMEWDGLSLGNGSVVEVTFGTVDWPKKGKIPAGIKPVAYEVRVLKHLAYVKPEKPFVGDNDHGDALPTKQENWNE